ncbi:MAG: type VI secretion system baseplate subunit TssK [Proteobacteria bacterium]|nr:type VI secretion system baseplate subunit TssK [Pseudomonadota bacterium]
MNDIKRILWGEGMYLYPQGYQQLDLRIDQAATGVLKTLQRYHWGLGGLDLDTDVLREGLVKATRLDVTFRDGTRYAAPACEPLPQSRTLADLPQVGTQTVLYACLPNLDPYGGNAATGCEEEIARPARFRTAQKMFKDIYSDALEEELSFLNLDVRLMVHEENRDGFDSVPIARLVKGATGKWQEDEAYIPPLVAVSGSEQLLNMIQRLLDILMVKSSALSSTHRQRSKNVADNATADIASFWMLHTVNAHFALLNHLASTEPLHPEELYRALATLCGQLMTFSNTYKLIDLPKYDHEQLFDTFPRIDKMIRELIDTVISSRYVIIPLVTPKPSFYVGHLESDSLIENVDYFLSIQGEMDFSQVLGEVPSQFKVGSPESVEKILHTGMPGVNLLYTQQPPAYLPMRVGNHYFAFEPHGEIFDDMKKARSICIYVPESLSRLKLELIVSYR